MLPENFNSSSVFFFFFFNLRETGASNKDLCFVCLVDEEMQTQRQK